MQNVRGARRARLVTATIVLLALPVSVLAAGGCGTPGIGNCSTGFLVVSLIAIGFLLLMVLTALFEPAIRYRICRLSAEPAASADFLEYLEAITDARVMRATRAEVFTNGEHYYEAELAAIRAAERTVNLEAYIFQRGEVTRRFIAVLAERARAGVKVNVVIDAVGSFLTRKADLAELANAGGRVEWYHPIRWYTLARFNNRTHRELIVIDGRVAFVGGSGFADQWLFPKRQQPPWRDTMVRIEGDAVPALQATFADNWLEASGEVLAGQEFFPRLEPQPGLQAALVVNSSPSVGGSTRARILFQTLLASARKTIHITTPYFLPDASARSEIVRAVRRGAEVRVITPGKRSDIALTRSSSRRIYGELLQAGVRIFEYQPAMIHAKYMIVDGTWSVVGSTNFDHRSFGLNDEVNLAAFDEHLGARLEADFERDLRDSREITYQQWRKRLFTERLHEWLGWVLERQQ